MKKLLLLLVSTSCYAAMPVHIKPITADYHNYVSTICVNHIEYIMVATNVPNGVAITPSLDTNGKPKGCNY